MHHAPAFNTRPSASTTCSFLQYLGIPPNFAQDRMHLCRRFARRFSRCHPDYILNRHSRVSTLAQNTDGANATLTQEYQWEFWARSEGLLTTRVLLGWGFRGQVLWPHHSSCEVQPPPS